MRMMAGIDMKGMWILDLGSGSGILSVYARLLGAASVVAVDHDPIAAEAARKTLELNKTGGIMVACSGVEAVKGKFQVVLANLDFATFKAYGHDVVDLMEDGGWLIVSGIERQYVADTPRLFGRAACVKRARMKDWHGFVFRMGKGRRAAAAVTPSRA